MAPFWAAAGVTVLELALVLKAKIDRTFKALWQAGNLGTDFMEPIMEFAIPRLTERRAHYSLYGEAALVG
ncbi:Hypp271 [Branchiostoma lanceolatum]|uniref:Hypp271 protein n=1 Tax=Branchiostoma lanceolatum TaxID=7740 RepID=A0A8J9W2Z8_BRALA|nr:Hypp271 [Branchiostoma lanceolatum]